VIVFGVDKAKSESYIAKEPELSFLRKNKALKPLFNLFPSLKSLIYFHSSLLNKKLYIIRGLLT